ncbi:unnamed protein product [Pleuronectes platessa]|uniref:Uncharacterized protein n=1 Tax=Pleuronectes platessa TaxID=8262 RepID=A0A9N7U7T0_PLEPL|nr:unnamed protein product [Pleuronectes platessa]
MSRRRRRLSVSLRWTEDRFTAQVRDEEAAVERDRGHRGDCCSSMSLLWFLTSDQSRSEASGRSHRDRSAETSDSVPASSLLSPTSEDSQWNTNNSRDFKDKSIQEGAVGRSQPLSANGNQLGSAQTPLFGHTAPCTSCQSSQSVPMTPLLILGYRPHLSEPPPERIQELCGGSDQGCDIRALHHTWPGCSMPGNGPGGGSNCRVLCSPLAMLDVLGEECDGRRPGPQQETLMVVNSDAVRLGEEEEEEEEKKKKKKKQTHRWTHFGLKESLCILTDVTPFIIRLHATQLRSAAFLAVTQLPVLTVQMSWDPVFVLSGPRSSDPELGLSTRTTQIRPGLLNPAHPSLPVHSAPGGRRFLCGFIGSDKNRCLLVRELRRPRGLWEGIEAASQGLSPLDPAAQSQRQPVIKGLIHPNDPEDVWITKSEAGASFASWWLAAPPSLHVPLKPRVKPGGKSSAAAPTCVYSAADHVSTLRPKPKPHGTCESVQETEEIIIKKLPLHLPERFSSEEVRSYAHTQTPSSTLSS